MPESKQGTGAAMPEAKQGTGVITNALGKARYWFQNQRLR